MSVSKLGVSEPKPFVIITLGPTGAGKTGLVTETIKLCKLKSNPPPTVFLVDDLVVNNKKYKEAVNGIITNNNMTSETVEKLMTTKSVIDAFNDAYWKVRKSVDCVGENSPNCDDVIDDRIKAAIQAKQSFVLEITGSSIPKWILSKNWLGNDPTIYDVFVSCVFVSNLGELIQRNKSRFKQAFESFIIDNTNNPAPRLPNINEQTFKETILTIKKTLDAMYSQCVLPPKDVKDQQICGIDDIEQLLVYSNNSKMVLEFDSKTDEHKKFEEVIAKFLLTDVTGGRRRRTQKRRKFHKRNNTKKIRKSKKNNRIRKHSKI